MQPKVNPYIPLVAIVGPTASGKSELGLKLAKKFGGFVISADSRQVYRHASIGTNQPVGQWLMANSKRRKIFGNTKLYFVKGVPHFFIDALSPTKTYSAAQFQDETNRLYHKLYAAGFLPILVGGTGLYVSAIVENYSFPNTKANLKLRATLERLSTAALLKKLKKLDPQTHLGIEKSNRRRLIRALEHVLTTGESFHGSQQHSLRPHTLILGLNPKKVKLKKNIERRTTAMLRHGLLNETRYLKRRYPNSPLLHTIGYQELMPVLAGQRTLAEAHKLIVTHTWQYARRQMTWFKRLPNVKWIKNYSQAKVLANKFLR